MNSPLVSHVKDNREQQKSNGHRVVTLLATTMALLLLGTWKMSAPATNSQERNEHILSMVQRAGQDIPQNPFANEFAAIDRYAAELTPPLVIQMKGTAVLMAKHYAEGGVQVSQITVPVEPAQYLQRIRYNGIIIPAYLEDENNSAEVPIGAWAKSTRELYPATNEYFPSIAESRQWIQDALGIAYRTDGEYAEWTDVTSDADMTRWGFFGMGSHITRTRRGGDARRFALKPKLARKIAYVSDVTALSLYEVREGYVRFGAAAFFNRRKKIKAIYVSYLDRVFRAGDPAWEHAKFVWKSSLMTQVTFVDHLLHTHFVEANTLSIACRENLPPDHPLRRFLKAHIFRTDSINRAALRDSAGHGELFHATWSFTFDSLYAMLADFRKTYTYRPYIERIQENGMENESPLEYPLKDIIPYWLTTKRYVRRYLDIYYATNKQLQADAAMNAFWKRLQWGLSLKPVEKKLIKADLSEVLTHLIVVVTGLHELYGTVIPITGRASSYTTRLRAGQAQADIQAFAAVGSLAVTLSGDFPLIVDDFSFLFLRDGKFSEVMTNFKRFQSDLKQLSKNVARKNKMRMYPFWYFDPQYMECSVSI